MRKRIRLRRKPHRAGVSSPVAEQREPDPSSVFASPIEQTLFLQRTLGNRGVQALIESGAFHEKSATASPSRRPRPGLYAVPNYPVRKPVLRHSARHQHNARIQSGSLSDLITATVLSKTAPRISTTFIPDISRKAETPPEGLHSSASTSPETQPERSTKEPLVADSTSDHQVAQLGAGQPESKLPPDRRGQQETKRDANVIQRDAGVKKPKAGGSSKSTDSAGSVCLVQRDGGSVERDDCGEHFTFQFAGEVNSEKAENHRHVPRYYYASLPTGSSAGVKFAPLNEGSEVYAGELSGAKKNGLWRSVCLQEESTGAPRQIVWALNEYIDRPAAKSPPAKAPGKASTAIDAEDDIKQIFKPGWTEVNELGIAYKQEPIPDGGAKLRAATGGHGRMIRHLPPNTKVYVLRFNAKQKVYAVTTVGASGGEFGYIASYLLARHLPDPEADILQIKSGDTPIEIAKTHYAKKGFNVWGKDARYVVSALAWVNQRAKHNFPGASGIRKAGKLSDPWYTAKATADHYIWLPGKDHINALYETIAKHGGGTGSLTADIWRGIKKVGEYVAYGAAFVGGLVHGFVKSIYDAIAGLVGMAVDVLTSIFTLNVVKDANELWNVFSKITWKDIKAALGAFVDSWEKKLNSNSPWVAGHAHGYLTGYIMAEAAQLLLTAGHIAYLKAAIWGSRLGKAIKATKAFQAFTKGVEKTSAAMGKGKKSLGKAGSALRRTKPFKVVSVAKTWIRDALLLSGRTVKDLTLDGINKLRTLSDDALSQIRKLSQPAKRFCLGCTSPCRVNLDDIKKYLAAIAGKGGAGAKKLLFIDDVLKAVPASFDTSVIAKKLKKHKTLMEAIKKAEITADDLGVMAKFFTPADKGNPVTAYRTFVRTLTALVPAKVGPDIKKFNELAEALVALQRRMGSALKGSMFETFTKLHLGRFRNLTFGRARFSKIVHKVLKKTRTSDGFVDSAGALWDFKHVVGKVPKDQVKDYLNIMAMKLKSTEGKVVKSVNYLFPTKEVAELNADLIGKGINVFYVSGKSTVTRLKP